MIVMSFHSGALWLNPIGERPGRVNTSQRMRASTIRAMRRKPTYSTSSFSKRAACSFPEMPEHPIQHAPLRPAACPGVDPAGQREDLRLHGSQLPLREFQGKTPSPYPTGRCPTLPRCPAIRVNTPQRKSEKVTALADYLEKLEDVGPWRTASCRSVGHRHLPADKRRPRACPACSWPQGTPPIHGQGPDRSTGRRRGRYDEVFDPIDAEPEDAARSPVRGMRVRGARAPSNPG